MRRTPRPPAPEGRHESTPSGAPAWLDLLAPPGVEILFFGGKGGVGKTTCATAAALALARHRPDRRVLLLSTDPAHSLADVLASPLGDDERRPRGAPRNLLARELDAAAALERWSAGHGAEAEAAFAGLTGVPPAAGLLPDLVPPGLDEIVAVAALADALGESRDLIVVDTAPTGHALRLLAMPGLALEWDHALLAILLKYREAVPPGELAAELVAFARGLRRLRDLLADPARAGFVPVTRAAELPRRETARLLGELRRLRLGVPAVIVDAATPAGPCERCAALAGEEERQIARLGGSRRCAMIVAPASFPPPRGAGPLLAWGRTWETRPE